MQARSSPGTKAQNQKRKQDRTTGHRLIACTLGGLAPPLGGLPVPTIGVGAACPDFGDKAATSSLPTIGVGAACPYFGDKAATSSSVENRRWLRQFFLTVHRHCQLCNMVQATLELGTSSVRASTSGHHCCVALYNSCNDAVVTLTTTVLAQLYSSTSLCRCAVVSAVAPQVSETHVLSLGIGSFSQAQLCVVAQHSEHPGLLLPLRWQSLIWPLVATVQ